MKGKEINKILRREGNKLPLEMYVAYPKELIDMPVFDENGNDTGKTEKKWITVSVEYPINHGRRMKRIWKRTKSFLELDNYLKQRGFELRWRT